METKMTVIKARDLAPQWVKATGNLGDYSVQTKEFTPDGLLATLSEKREYLEHACALLNNQDHITYGSRMFTAEVERELPVFDRKVEKAEAWSIRNYPEAVKIAQKIAPTVVLDYVEAFKTDALKVKKEKVEAKPVLANYDAVEAGLLAHWDGWDEARKSATCDKLAIVVAPGADAAGALASLAAKYARPVAVVSEDELFA